MACCEAIRHELGTDTLVISKIMITFATETLSMYKDKLGNTYSSYQEYVNSPNLDMDLVYIKLWKGERTPQNDKERRIKKELDEMRAKGQTPEFYFD